MPKHGGIPTPELLEELEYRATNGEDIDLTKYPNLKKAVSEVESTSWETE